ncbi:unnamed protein product [Meloidogyne enterolobii]|uniref:Uncharacterized protein n=1 Tax=Meloidogyne enterolobii TaxID=390850 RepID=A0ACB1APV0_MELEN
MYESSQKNHSSSSKRQQKQQQQLNGHTNGRIGSGRRVHVLDNNIYSQQHPSKMVVDHTCSSSPQQCDCCPYGYHIDLGFNWSNEEKKRNRRLLASPSSDKTMLDLSGSDIANISSSYPANDSILSTNFSPYMEEEELPELLEQQTHQQYQQQPHFNNNSNICFNNQQQNGNNKHNLTNRQTSSISQQQQLQSILKKNADVWKQGNISNSQTQVLRNINQQVFK